MSVIQMTVSAVLVYGTDLILNGIQSHKFYAGTIEPARISGYGRMPE